MSESERDNLHYTYTKGYRAQNFSSTYGPKLQKYDGQSMTEFDLQKLFTEMIIEAKQDHETYGDRPHELFETFISLDYLRPLPSIRRDGRSVTPYYIQVDPESRLPFLYSNEVCYSSWNKSKSPALDQIYPPRKKSLYIYNKNS